MKKLLLSLTFVGFCTAIYSQGQPVQMEAPQWVELMKDGDIPVEEIIQMHDQYWEGREITKGCGWKPFKRWEWSMLGHTDEQGLRLSGREVAEQWQAARDFNSMRSPAGNWQPLGPILDGVTTREDIRGVGRTASIAFHPTDENIIFVGTPAGGLWRTYDGGESWVSNTDELPTLGVSAVAIDPFNPDIVYIGTGDRDAADAVGMGVMKSTDGGLTWDFANQGMEDLGVGDLLVHPDDPNIVIAATNDGIFRSTDGAESWTYSSPNATDYRDIKFKPGDPNVVYATSNGKFYRSLDNGVSWTWINDGILSSQRMVIGVTPANPELVYVCSASTYEFQKFYRSTDGGSSFETMSDEPNILGWAADGSSGGGQAWYDLCMTAHPENSDVVYVGGIRMKRSDDGGATWVDINPNYLHVDQHECDFSPLNGDLYLANDGGFYRYVDNEEWLDISNGIVNGQIYKMGQSPHVGVKALTGFQDNGSMQYNGAQWSRVGGGDGFECIYDHSDPDWRYTSLYYGQIYRTSPEHSNQKICGDEVLGIDESGAWSSPFILSWEDENTMFAGLKNIWRTKNIKHPIKDSIVWEKISDMLGNNNSLNLISIEQSKVNPDIVYTCKGTSKFFRTDNGNDDEVNWLNLSTFLEFTSEPVLDIESHPYDEDIVYIAYDNRIWKSEDRGVSWEDISGTLPDVRMNTIAYDKDSDEGLYVGTDFGIYFKDASMDDWIPFSTGFPPTVRVTELEIYNGPTLAESRIRASTYGRGLWESDLFDAETYEFPSTAFLYNQNESVEVYDDFDVDALFYKSLEIQDVSDFDTPDVYVENGTLNSISGGPANYVLNITPENYGPVKIYVEDDAAIDADGILTDPSDTLLLYFNPEPEVFGIYGPGGVGDENTIALWLRADIGAQYDGSPAVNEGPVDLLIDESGNIDGAAQDDEQSMPIWLDGDNGISGIPAIYFDGTDNYLQANGVVPGENLSVFSMIEGDSIAYNTHGWVASARMPNGFVLHPWENESRYSAMVIDDEDNYANGPVQYIGDAAAPHIHGLVYERTDYYQVHHTLYDDSKWIWNGAEIGPRNGTAAVDVRYGWDYDERFGKGKMSEHFILNRRIHESHRVIIANYLAAKYGIDLGLIRRYENWSKKYEVAGIGQETDFDKHLDAQGTGIVRMTAESGADNGDYLLWGHNNSALAWTDESFPILSERIQRTWGVNETGDFGEVLVRIDAEAIPDNANSIGLIVGDTPDFQAGQSVEFYPLTLADGVYSAMVDFPADGVFTIGVEPQVGLEELNQQSVQVYPNPTSEMLNVSVALTEFMDIQVEIIDAIGRTVDRIRMTDQITQFDVSGLAKGSYQLRISNQDQVVVKQVVIQ